MKRFFPTPIHKSETLKKISPGPRGVLQKNIQILVWNIFKGKKLGWLEDLERLADQMDLVLLQESPLHEECEDYFFKVSPHEWIMAQSFVQRDIYTGVKTGAKIASTSQEYYRSPHREPMAQTPKMALATTYPLENHSDEMLVLNVHAVNFVSTRKFGKQMEQLGAVLKDYPGPVILGGDFNTWSKARRDIFGNLTKEHELQEVIFGNAVPKFRHMNRIIDHVFYKNLILDKAEMLTDIGSSDHHPLRVNFKIPETPGHTG